MADTSEIPDQVAVAGFAPEPGGDRAIGMWLLLVALMVFVMVVIGGVTRLTNSGLSMVDWQPIMGVLPPLSDAEWEATFDAYKAYPEYQKINVDMQLDGFKQIFFWEYSHRVFGRLIGLVFFLPYLYFLVRGRVRGPMVWKLGLALLLGGLQGLMGWYMVKSGLVDRPDVSHYRLAAHLILAVVVLAWLVWLSLEIFRQSAISVSLAAAPYLGRVVTGLGVLLLLQITWGAFTAGLNAGFGFNTFPMMGDEWLATGAFMLSPWWVNFFENTSLLQFVHRWLGALFLAGVIVVWWRAKPISGLDRAAHLLLAATIAQFLLGIATLVMAVPIVLASLHQAVACLLVVALVNFGHVVTRRSA